MNIKVFLSTEFLSNIAQCTHEDLFEIKRKRVLHTKYLPCLQAVNWNNPVNNICDEEFFNLLFEVK